MTELLNTNNANAESPVFSPAGEFYVQVSASAPTTVFDIMARVDANADWLVIDTLSTAAETIGRYAALPFMKIAVRNNVVGNAAKAWTNT